MVDIEDMYVTPYPHLAMILLIMCFVISYFSILTHGIGLQINQYSFVLETKYSNSKNCYSFQH